MGARRWKEPVNHPTFVLPRPWPTHTTSRRKAFFFVSDFLKSNQSTKHQCMDFQCIFVGLLRDISFKAVIQEDCIWFVWIKPDRCALAIREPGGAWRWYRGHPCLSDAFRELCHRNSAPTCHSAPAPAPTPAAPAATANHQYLRHVTVLAGLLGMGKLVPEEIWLPESRS